MPTQQSDAVALHVLQIGEQQVVCSLSVKRRVGFHARSPWLDSPNDTVHPAAEVDLPLETDPTGGLGATVCSDDTQ